MSLEEDRALLKAVKEWRPPQNQLHPIAVHAWNLYEDAGMDLPSDRVAQIRGVLDSYGDDLVALAEALEGLTRFAMLLTDHRDDHENGSRIVELMREYTHLFEPFWERVGEALTNVGSDAKTVFGDFSNHDDARNTAPRYGDAAPDNTIPLREIAPHARPPPWAKKVKKAKRRAS
jgi:hypothetical protein